MMKKNVRMWMRASVWAVGETEEREEGGREGGKVRVHTVLIIIIIIIILIILIDARPHVRVCYFVLYFGGC